MTRVAILGANGQVGAEVCLILKNHPSVELVPICRNRMGSAYLRYRGVRCRHGLAADAKQVSRLLRDCDLVLNLALSSGGTLPRVAREDNRVLIYNSVAYSHPRARVVYFSTRAVYGDPRVGVRFRRKGAYGKEKLRCERDVRRYCNQYGKECHILRLGHVCGELQNITAQVRGRIADGPVMMPDPRRLSDTVYTATIVDAILKIADGREPPGTYDLMNSPQWSWKEVFDFEAERMGQVLEIETGAQSSNHRTAANPTGVFLSLIRFVAKRGQFKDAGLQVASRLSPAFNERLRAANSQNRARGEVAVLHRREPSMAAFTQVAFGKHFLSSLEPTIELLKRSAFRPCIWNRESAWSEDLPAAE